MATKTNSKIKAKAEKSSVPPTASASAKGQEEQCAERATDEEAKRSRCRRPSAGGKGPADELPGDDRRNGGEGLLDLARG
jgi:hypothetical protein